MLQFVYEPLLAPKLEIWAEQFIAARRARKRAKEGPMAVPAPSGRSEDMKLPPFNNGATLKEPNDIELEKLFAKEMDAWRNEVDSNRDGSHVLRHRSNASGSGNTLIHVR